MISTKFLANLWFHIYIGPEICFVLKYADVPPYNCIASAGVTSLPI